MAATYKEYVDDILIFIREHNEQKKDVNPNWIFWKLLKSIEYQRNIYLERLKGLDVAPLWARTVSSEIYPTQVTSGNLTNVLDPDLKLAQFLLPSVYSRMNAVSAYEGIIDIYPGMQQKKLILKSQDSVIRRIRAKHPMLRFYYYGFIQGEFLYAYPFVPVIKLQYIPLDLWDVRPDPSATVIYPETIIKPAIQDIKDELRQQAQIKADEIPDLLENSHGPTN